MKKTKIDLSDIAFSYNRLENLDLEITGEIGLRSVSRLSFEVASEPAAREAACKKLALMLLMAVYGDVWDLAAYADILIKDNSPYYHHASDCKNPVIEMLAILGQIGQCDDRAEIDRLLEPYRNPEGRPNNER